MTAHWQAAHAYVAGDLITPATDNGHVYYCSVAGTSAASEPTWANRYPGVVDGTTLTWVPYTVITPSGLRDLMGWDTDTSNQTQPNHTDTVLGNYLLDAIDELEKTTRRYFVSKPGKSLTYTSMLRATIPLPGIRSVTSVVYAGTTLDTSGYWLLPDAQQTGVYTGIQFRAFRTTDNGPWWLADPLWFDKALDSPFNPGNYGGGYVFTSMPNDTVIVGDGGYTPGSEPGGFIHALGVLAGFMAMRPTALLADSIITPQGGVMSYASMPPEVSQFVKDWSAGQQAVSLG